MNCSSSLNLPLALELKNGWHGNNLRPQASILISEQAIQLEFEVAHPVIYDTSLKELDFVEGLWQQDCFEFFIAEISSNKYQEFNFAPSGALWSAVFSDYRVQEASSKKLIEAFQLKSKVSPDAWQLKLTIPRRILTIKLTNQLKCNLTAVLDGEFYSWSDIHSDNPDFHLADQFNLITIDQD